MFINKSSWKSLLASVALASCAAVGIHNLATAQSNPGLIIFGDRDVDHLNYRLDRGGDANQKDRYRLRIPKKKLENGAIRFVISYPDYFDGEFDLKKEDGIHKYIEVRPNGDKDKALALKDVIWDKENRFLQIDLAEPLVKPKKLEIVLSQTRNPDMGTYYLRAQVTPATNTPLPEVIGAWVVTINP